MITSIELVNFRNHEKLKLDFNKNIVYIWGKNGSGKTSILEAIYFTSTTKSHRTNLDQEMIAIEKPFMVTRLAANKNSHELVLSKYGKRLKFNGLELKKISEYIARLKVVMFSPEDLSIIKGTPSDRRQFFDLSFSQIDTKYMELLTLQKKILRQRNALLKRLKVTDDRVFLNILSQQLYDVSIRIIEFRKEKIRELSESFNESFKLFKIDEVEIKYIPSATPEALYNSLFKKQDIDIMYQATQHGVHKDDLTILVNGLDAKVYSSQGEQRFLIICLKLGLLTIYKKTSTEVVLLLDDVLSELDGELQNLFLIKLPTTHQIFITSTHDNEMNDNIQNIEIGKD